MDKDFLKTLSDLELARLQNEAKVTDDAVLVILREREKQESTPERFKYMRIYLNRIMMQFDGVGAMLKIDKNDNSQTVVDKLRHFAKLLERSIAERTL